MGVREGQLRPQDAGAIDLTTDQLPAISALIFLSGVLLGALLGLLGGLRLALPHLIEARREAQTALERLIYASKDGHFVPPADAVASATPATSPGVNLPPEPLPEPLRDLVNRWEKPETRHLEEERIRIKLSQGHSPLAILKEYED